MQQHARPPWSQHHFHLARRRLARAKLHNGLPCGFCGKVFRGLLRLEVFQRDAPAAAGRSPRRDVTVFGNAQHVHACQRLKVGGKCAIGADD